MNAWQGSNVRTRRLTAAIGIAGAAILSGLIASAPMPASAQSPQAPRPKGDVEVKVHVEQFFVRGGSVVAEGPSTATFTGRDGSTYSTEERIELRVDTTKNCRVLELHLAELYVNLLGLQVRTSTINLRVTGDRNQALGKLFCKLSDSLKLSKEAAAKRAVKSLNARLDNKPLHLLAFSATVHGQTQPAGARQQAPPPPADACPVLDLLLGPLDLDLLGLVVELHGAAPGDPVRVNVVADPNGGQLGSTFCQLSAS